jgi:hypothetical protein
MTIVEIGVVVFLVCIAGAAIDGWLSLWYDIDRVNQ